MVIEDVLRDFASLREDNGAPDTVRSVLRYAMQSECLAGAEPGDCYAILMFLLYQLLDEEFGCGGDEQQMQAQCDCLLSAPREDLLTVAGCYQWIPPALHQICLASYQIFQWAQQAWFGLDTDRVEEAETLMQKIRDYGERIGQEDDTYRSRDEIRALYEQELSECEVDMETIRGNRILFSFRMRDYVEQLQEMSDSCDRQEAELEMYEPFAVPDDLFGTGKEPMERP